MPDTVCGSSAGHVISVLEWIEIKVSGNSGKSKGKQNTKRNLATWRKSPQNSVTIQHASDKKPSTFLKNSNFKDTAVNNKY